MRVKVATMPEGEDPDTWSAGAAALVPILKDAVDVLDRKIQLLERKGWFEGMEHRRDALDRLLPTARAAADPIARDLYLARISERTGVSRAVLEREEASRPPPPPERPAGLSSRPDRRRCRPAAGSREPGSSSSCSRRSSPVGPGSSARGRKSHLRHSRSPRTVRSSRRCGHCRPRHRPPPRWNSSPPAQDAFQRLLLAASEERAAGVSFDEVYAGALQGLRAREVSRSLAPVSAVEQRQHQLKELSSDQRARFIIRKAAAKEPPPWSRSHPALFEASCILIWKKLLELQAKDLALLATDREIKALDDQIAALDSALDRAEVTWTRRGRNTPRGSSGGRTSRG